MVELFERHRQTNDRKSSKGNQLKWLDGDTWYKADYTGYEGLSEYMTSALLSYSSLNENEFASYMTELVHYKTNKYIACKCKNFLPNGWKLITLERLFQSVYGKSLNSAVYLIDSHAERLRFLVEQTIRITGLKEFGPYMSKLLTIDALFLNEDRHTHNIAVLLDNAGKYHYCPVFDNGAALLSDTTMDYPINAEVERLTIEAKPKTICQDFDEQLDIAEHLYGQHINFHFDASDVASLLSDEFNYPDNIKTRVRDIILMQRRKYGYLFSAHPL